MSTTLAQSERHIAEEEVKRIAASYPPEARSTPVWERERYFSPDQRLAWEMRFAKSEALQP